MIGSGYRRREPLGPGTAAYLMTCSPSQRLNGESPNRNWPQVPESETTL